MEWSGGVRTAGWQERHEMMSVGHVMTGHMTSQQLWLPAQNQASWNQKFQHEVPGEGLLETLPKRRTACS